MAPFPYYNEWRNRELRNNALDFSPDTEFNGLEHYAGCVSPAHSSKSLLLKYFQEDGIKTVAEARELILRKTSSDNDDGDVLCSLRDTWRKCKLSSLVSLNGFVHEGGLGDFVCRQGNGIYIERKYVPFAEEAGMKIYNKHQRRRPAFGYELLPEGVPYVSLNNEISLLLRMKPAQMHPLVSKNPPIRRMVKKNHRGARVVRKDMVPGFVEAAQKTEYYKSITVHA